MTAFWIWLACVSVFAVWAIYEHARAPKRTRR